MNTAGDVGERIKIGETSISLKTIIQAAENKEGLSRYLENEVLTVKDWSDDLTTIGFKYDGLGEKLQEELTTWLLDIKPMTLEATATEVQKSPHTYINLRKERLNRGMCCMINSRVVMLKRLVDFRMTIPVHQLVTGLLETMLSITGFDFFRQRKGGVGSGSDFQDAHGPENDQPNLVAKHK